jgi:hypothetical protein
VASLGTFDNSGATTRYTGLVNNVALMGRVLALRLGLSMDGLLKFLS